MSFVEDKIALTYDDVLLVPQYSEVTSRTQVDLSVAFEPNCNLSVPVVSRSKIITTILLKSSIMIGFVVKGLACIAQYLQPRCKGSDTFRPVSSVHLLILVTEHCLPALVTALQQIIIS